MLERLPNLVDLDVVMKTDKPYYNNTYDYANLHVNMTRIRAWLLDDLVHSFRHPKKLCSVRVSVELFRTEFPNQRRKRFLDQYAKTRKVKTVTGEWRVDEQEHNPACKATEVTSYGEALGYANRKKKKTVWQKLELA